MNKIYNVYWSQTALDELCNIVAYPSEVNNEELVVWIDGIKDKRENVYWKIK